MLTFALVLVSLAGIGVSIEHRPTLKRESHLEGLAAGDSTERRNTKSDELERTRQALSRKSVARLLLAMKPPVLSRAATRNPEIGTRIPAIEKSRLSEAVPHAHSRGSAPVLVDARSGENKTAWRVRGLLNRWRNEGKRNLSNSGSGSSWIQRLLQRLKKFVRIDLLVVLCVILVLRLMRSQVAAPIELSYATFMRLVELQASGEIAAVTNMVISPRHIAFLLDGRPHFTRRVLAPADLIKSLQDAGIDFYAAAQRTNPLSLLFPIAYLVLMSRFLSQNMGGRRKVSKKTSSFRISDEGFSFDDVAGIDVAKNEVQEIVSMLADPDKYAAAGARLPSGVLMVGPPGTGKTMMARAMASQAGVPFFYCSGSDFVELFVGLGASRIRELFKEAGKTTPCLIFIDELDALGKKRSLRIGGSNDEAEQTLNQLLACMDGLETTSNGVIVMGATNRYEIIDPALTRPGRFDRVVRVDLPDRDGREAILRVHTRKLQLENDVDLRKVADITPSYSGADLAALANEAAIRAVRRSSVLVSMVDFLDAVQTYSQNRFGLPNIQNMIPDWMRQKESTGGKEPP